MTNDFACRLETQPPLEVLQSSLKSGMVSDFVKSDAHWQNLFGTKMATKSDAPFIGLLVRQFSFVFFGMFELTSVSFGIALNLVGQGHGVAAMRDRAASG